MWDDPATYPNLIPLIWQGDGPNPSPGYSTRGSMYGVGGIPHSQWNGSQNYIGGGTSTLPAYINLYNNISAENSPAEMTLELNTNAQGQLAFLLDVTLTGDITTTNNQIVYVLTHDWEPGQLPDYFASVILYEQEPFDLTSTGQTGSYEYAFDMAANWDLSKMKAVAMIQTFSGNHKVHQAAITDFTGLLPMFTSNVTVGPPSLGVQFTSNSFPITGIDSWEWDFDGDGTFDSTQENPYHLYDTVGIYDVTLRIGVDGEYEEITVEDYITVNDGSSISGDLSGIWTSVYNPYVITDDVEISEFDYLMILPGVQINVAADKQFTIYGQIIADASSNLEEPIIFTSDDEWEGLKFSNTQSDNQIKNCHFSHSNVSAITIENDSYVDIIGNVFTENSSSSTGAAIDISSSDNVFISQNIIANNTSSNNAGGIFCINSSVEISNNIVVNNSGAPGAFSFKNGSDVLLVNNTIANNESINPFPYLFFIFNAMPTIKNCIIIDTGTIFYAPFGDPDVTYTCITGGFTGEGNIDDDPMFIDPSAGNGSAYNGLTAVWGLLEGSPCIDAGNPDPIYNDPDGTRNDMGAYGGPNGLILLDAENEVIEVISQSSINVYPNPFNPSGAGRSPQTTIALNMTEIDNLHPVTVEIYNIKGQLVRTVVDNQTIQNNAKFIWNGTDNNGMATTSGLYFVKLKTASSTSVVKMMLMK